MFPAGERYRKYIRSAEAIRSWRVMAEDRGMTVGARDARFMLNRVGVRPDREKGVVGRSLFGEVEATCVCSDMPGVRRGEVERPAAFSSVAARFRLSCSVKSSPVLAVLRFVCIPSGLRPTTVP